MVAAVGVVADVSAMALLEATIQVAPNAAEVVALEASSMAAEVLRALPVATVVVAAVLAVSKAVVVM